MIDSNDPDRIDMAKEELMAMMNDEELKNVSLLVFANKQDIPGAMTVPEISDKLGLSTLRGHKWFI